MSHVTEHVRLVGKHQQLLSENEQALVNVIGGMYSFSLENRL